MRSGESAERKGEPSKDGRKEKEGNAIIVVDNENDGREARRPFSSRHESTAAAVRISVIVR